MSNLTAAADAEMKYIKKLIDKTGDSVACAPEGSLNIERKNGKLYFYHRIPGEKKKIYLSKDDTELVRTLAQKDYDMKILRNLIARKMALEKFEEIYPEASLESIYENLCPERKQFVKPVILTDAQYVSMWENTPFTGKTFDEDDTSAFFTEKGERVRSKSELLIASYLSHAGIPYKYECPLVLSERTLYPDFTLLDVKRRRTLYLEHFGMMDEPRYAEIFTQKLITYQDNEIYLGQRLIATFETTKKALDMQTVKQTVDHYFL